MNRYLVYGEKSNGNIERYSCYAINKEQAEQKILNNDKNLVKVQAFDWDIQYRYNY